jgi:hypothetical protein
VHPLVSILAEDFRTGLVALPGPAREATGFRSVFGEAVPDDRLGRWHVSRRIHDWYDPLDLVVFDAEGGIETDNTRGLQGSSRRLFLSEIAKAFRQGKSVLVQQPFPKGGGGRVAFIAERVKDETGTDCLFCLSAGKLLWVLVPWPTWVEEFRGRVERAKKDLGVGLKV